MAMTQKISIQELQARLSDPSVPDSELRPYLMVDRIESQGFRPIVTPNPALVDYGAEEAAVALASLNGVSRWRRQTRYRQKIGGWSGLRVVAEGDSWFQYPFLLDDVVDQLFDRWAIYCCSAAGDLLNDMARQDELGAAVIAERPDIVILSGGGNDLLGDGRLARFLRPHTQGLAPGDYILPEFDGLLTSVIETYRDLIAKILQPPGQRRVVCHSYDYPVPNGGQWLGRPMQKLGIANSQTQRAIVRLLIDKFHEALSQMAAGFGGSVTVADCRGTVGASEWHDELHPTSAAFKRVARIICAAAERTNIDVVNLETLEAPEAGGLAPVSNVNEVNALLATDSDRLVSEIGRRSAIMELSPDAAGELQLEIPQFEEGFVDTFRELGQKVLDRWQRELYRLMCGDGGAATEERDKLRSALGLEQAAMVGAISAALMAIAVPPLIAPLLAAIIVKNGINPAWEVTCEVWGKKFQQ
jgi:lysophospholipase L1-like esterase